MTKTKSRDNDLPVDPDPISLVLEIANLVFQPGSLALIAASTSALYEIKNHQLNRQDLSEKNRSQIRNAIFTVERALNQGSAVLRNLASIFDQYGYLETPIMVGGAPISGYKNSRNVRRWHEDARAAVKDARDAFMDLSSILPSEYSGIIRETLDALNNLSDPLLGFRRPYGLFFVAAAKALDQVYSLIGEIGKDFDYQRQSNTITEDLIRIVPKLKRYS